MILSKQKRSAATAWLERVNPLQGLTIAQAKSIFDVARAHGSPLLQKIYEEIELTDPVLMTCVERRQSAIAGLGWRAVANASAADPDKAEAQRKALEEFANGIENLDDAIEHLDLAFFRGYSVVQPIWENNAPKVHRVVLLNSWNFLRGDDGRLMWNPDCILDPNGCEEITADARTVQIIRRRAIDWPALSIYIRKYVGERDWGRFLERYGIPPVDVVMAPNATDKDKDEYLACAEAAKNGSSVAYPSGTEISRAETSRGQDPFTAFIEHQEKLIVLMATGGTLTSLAQADTGSLAGGAQMDVWEQIVQRDGVVISAALNRDLFIPFLRERFPGEPIMAHFEIGKEDEPSATEAADLAGKLKVAGWRVDQSQLEEQTGFKLEREESVPQPMPFGNPQPSDAAPAEDVAATALNGAQVTSMVTLLQQASQGQIPKDSIMPILKAAFPNVADETLREIVGPLDKFSAPEAIARAKRVLGRARTPAAPRNENADLLKAFASDMSEAGKAVAELLKDPTPEAASALIERLPDLLKGDMETAAILAEAMANEFVKKEDK